MNFRWPLMPPPPHFRTIILRNCSGIHDRSTSNKNIGLKISPPTELFRKLICFGRVTLPLVKDGWILSDQPRHGKSESLCSWAGDRDVRDAEVGHSVHHLDHHYENDDK